MLTIRKAQKDDAEFFYNLRFSDEVIAASFTKVRPSLQEHIKWFNEKLNSQNVIMLIASEQGKSIGYLRYNLSGYHAEISIALAPEVRGKGLGQKLLNEGESWMKKNTEVKVLTAKVLPGNTSSLKMFEAQGFTNKLTSLEKVIDETWKI
jgi:UDP-2,4-diacetamido-2,4,6-trideoxy-beta-L-altropyranose hydrolase